MMRCWVLRTALKTPKRSLSSAQVGAIPDPPGKALEGAEWIDAASKTYKIFTDNRFVSVSTSTSHLSFERFDVVNPANRHLLGTVLDAAAAEGEASSSSSSCLLDDLVRKSREAFQEWRDVPVQRRQRAMADYALLVKDATPILAELICLENGKTLADARGDVFRGLEVVETAAGVAAKMLGSSILNLAHGVDCASYRIPLGVCAAICPFNFPAMASWLFLSFARLLMGALFSSAASFLLPTSYTDSSLASLSLSLSRGERWPRSLCGHSLWRLRAGTLVSSSPARRPPAPPSCWPSWPRRLDCRPTFSRSCRVGPEPSRVCARIPESRP
jgi:hypothetical protein